MILIFMDFISRVKEIKKNKKIVKEFKLIDNKIIYLKELRGRFPLWQDNRIIYLKELNGKLPRLSLYIL